MPEIASSHVWARETAERIRAYEAANIDENAEQRTAAIEALVRKSLSAIPPSMKAAYLDELDTHFPAEALQPAAAAQGTERAAEPAADMIQRRLAELASAERHELLRQLLTSALRESHSGSRLGRLMLEGPRKLGAAATTPPPLDPERMLRVLEVFCESVLGLQRLAIELWREVGSRKLSGTPALASDAEFRANIARCLAGDADVPPALIEQEVERQRRAIAAAMALLGPFAETFAQAVLKPLAPETVQASAATDSFSMFGSREAGYWKHYCRTCESLGEEHFETVLVECLSKHLRTLNRSNP